MSMDIIGAIDHWPAKDLWTDEYLCKKMHDNKVTVAGNSYI